jgi:opacity protein-like surface antigen
MLKKSLYLLSVCSLIFSSTVAVANSDYAPSSHPYVGVGLGYGGMYLDGDSAQNSGFAYQINGGYVWQLTNSFAFGLEANYTGYPKATSQSSSGYHIPLSGIDVATDSQDTLTGHSVAALFFIQFFITPRFSLNAKVGTAYMMQTDKTDSTTTITTKHWDGSSTTTQSSDSNIEDILGVAPIVGLGAAYAITPNLSLTFDGQMLLETGMNDGLALQLLAASGSPAYTALVGIQYRF